MSYTREQRAANAKKKAEAENKNTKKESPEGYRLL